jgi:hypothetical protein
MAFLYVLTDFHNNVNIFLTIFFSEVLDKTCNNFMTGRSSQDEWGGQDMWHAWEGREKCTRFWWESPKETDHSEDQGLNGRMGSDRIGWGRGFDSTGSG